MMPFCQTVSKHVPPGNLQSDVTPSLVEDIIEKITILTADIQIGNT